MNLVKTHNFIFVFNRDSNSLSSNLASGFRYQKFRVLELDLIKFIHHEMFFNYYIVVVFLSSYIGIF